MKDVECPHAEHSNTLWRKIKVSVKRDLLPMRAPKVQVRASLHKPIRKPAAQDVPRADDQHPSGQPAPRARQGVLLTFLRTNVMTSSLHLQKKSEPEANSPGYPFSRRTCERACPPPHQHLLGIRESRRAQKMCFS